MASALSLAACADSRPCCAASKSASDVDHWSSYVGQGAVRFVLSFDVQPPQPSFGQTIIVTKSLEARDRLKPMLQDWLSREFVGTDAFVKLLDIGPPVGRPVQYRVSGPDLQEVRARAQQFATQAATVVAELKPSVDKFTAELPAGYKVETAGSVEESGKSLGPIVAVAPLMLFVMATVLMLQLQTSSSCSSSSSLRRSD